MNQSETADDLSSVAVPQADTKTQLENIQVQLNALGRQLGEQQTLANHVQRRELDITERIENCEAAWNKRLAVIEERLERIAAFCNQLKAERAAAQ